MKHLTAIIEPAEEGGYFAYCPEVVGANGQGETVEECYENLKLAIDLIFVVIKSSAIYQLEKFSGSVLGGDSP